MLYNIHRGDDMSFKTSVVTGQALISLVNNVKSFKTRDCFSQLMHYLKAPCDDKVCIVYGLRRTGKTTMLKQAIAELELERDKCAYITRTTPPLILPKNNSRKSLTTAKKCAII